LYFDLLNGYGHAMSLLALLVVFLKHIVVSTPKASVHVALCFKIDLSLLNDIELDDLASLVSRLL
jgi:hypothetical protein